LGSSALYVVSGSEQHATAEEIEVGSAVHLALDQLELVDLAFRLTAAPRQGIVNLLRREARIGRGCLRTGVLQVMRLA
jgi:hypothetical protein